LLLLLEAFAANPERVRQVQLFAATAESLQQLQFPAAAMGRLQQLWKVCGKSRVLAATIVQQIFDVEQM
jgi:hypothetical protein